MFNFCQFLSKVENVKGREKVVKKSQKLVNVVCKRPLIEISQIGKNIVNLLNTVF